jgi:signal transduction histidine kinase/CHASE1-domain containing sensor protein
MLVRLLPTILLLFGLTLTAVAWLYARSSFQNREQASFERRRDQARTQIVRRLDEQVSLLRGTAAMLAIEPDISAAQFKDYARTLQLEKNFAGLLGVGFAMKVDRPQIPEFEAELKRRGYVNFRVRPEKSKGDQYPIRLLEPEIDVNRRAIGYNMFSEDKRREAMERARDTGDAAISSKVVLVQDVGTNAPGFLIFVPFYAGRVIPDTVEHRRQAIRGFAYSPIRASEFFGEDFEDQSLTDIGVEIHSGPTISDSSILFRNEPANFAGRPITHSTIVQERIYGQDLVIRLFAPTYDSMIAGSDLLLWIPLLGITISLLIFAGIRSQLLAAEESRVLAAEANRRAERERLLSQSGRVLASSLDSQATLDEVAALAVPAFADWCTVDVPGPDGLPQRISVRHVDPEKIAYAHELSKLYPPNPDSHRGVSHVMRTGMAEYKHHIADDWLRNVAKDDRQFKLIKELGLTSYICVPMNIRGETLGVITYVSTNPERLYDEEDFHTAQEIAARAAVAIDNARLFEAAQREIADRRRAQDRVRELNVNLEQIVEERTRELRATNLELEAFCYSVSHDLRTPLRSVDGFSKALLEDYGDQLPAEAKGYLDRVIRANHRMDELITALLTLSRITRSEIVREPVDVSEIAEAALQEAARDRSPEALRVTIQPNMRSKADPRMVRILFDNLLNNAVKFNGNEKLAEIEVGQQAGVFFVRDNGVGFNSEYKTKLFVPFERLHSPREFSGTGVGLATVQRIVHKHGGDIWAESQVGEGATFYFTLG